MDDTVPVDRPVAAASAACVRGPCERRVATTMRIVNAIGVVGDAAPGLVSSSDLPLTLPSPD